MITEPKQFADDLAAQITATLAQERPATACACCTDPADDVRIRIQDELERARRNAQADQSSQFYDGMVLAYECVLQLLAAP